MDFFGHIKSCFIKYTDFSGRSSRSEYWNYTVFILVTSILFDYLDSIIAGVTYIDYSGFGTLSIIFTILTFFPSLAVSIRRLHDINKSGWWLLLILTLIGIIPLIYWACLPSNMSENRYD